VGKPGGAESRPKNIRWHTRLEQDGESIKVVLVVPFHSVQEVRGDDPRSGARVTCTVLSGGVLYRCASPTLRLDGWEALFPEAFTSAPGVHPQHGGFHEVAWTVAGGARPPTAPITETFYTNVNGVLLAGGSMPRMRQGLHGGLAAIRELFRRA
jgi:hypothetical protein